MEIGEISEKLAQKIGEFSRVDLQKKIDVVINVERLFGEAINTDDIIIKVRGELSNILGQNNKISLDNLVEEFNSTNTPKRLRIRRALIKVLCPNPKEILEKYKLISLFMKTHKDIIPGRKPSLSKKNRRKRKKYGSSKGCDLDEEILGKIKDFFKLQKNWKYLRYITPDFYGKMNGEGYDVRKILQSELGYGLPETFLGFENLFKKGKDSDGCDLICYLLDDKNLRQCYDQYLKVYNFFKDVKQKDNIDYLKNLKKESDKLLYIKAIVKKELGIDLFEGFGYELLADIENIKPYVTWKELYDFFSKPTNWKYYVFFSCPKGEKSDRSDQNTRKKNLAIQSIKSLLGCDRDLTNILNEKLTIKAFFAKLSKNGVANINYFKLYVAICEKFEEKLKNLIQGEDIKKRKKSIENIIDLNIKKIINEKKINADRWKYANKETKDFIVNDVLQFVDYF